MQFWKSKTENKRSERYANPCHLVANSSLRKFCVLCASVVKSSGAPCNATDARIALIEVQLLEWQDSRPFTTEFTESWEKNPFVETSVFTISAAYRLSEPFSISQKGKEN